MPMLLVILCWIAAAAVASAQVPSLDERLAELRTRLEREDPEAVTALADRLADEALAAGAPAAATLALRMVASFHIGHDRPAAARDTLARARDLAKTHGLVVAEQYAIILQARVAALEGRAPDAVGLVLPALEVIDREAVPREEAIWAYGQAASAVASTTAHGDVLSRGVARLSPGDRFSAACSLWHSWGDLQFAKADYGQAHEALTTALGCYEALGKQVDVGYVLVSLGRVQRAHGQLDTALTFYRRAARLQSGPRDLPALLQSLNAQAVTYDRLGQFARAERIYRDALARARRAGLERHAIFLRGNLAGSLLAAGRPEAALTELRAVLQVEKSPYLRGIRLRQSAEALRELRRYDEASAALEEARATEPAPGFDGRVNWLWNHAQLLALSGRLDQAQRDIDEAVALVEDARNRALSGDTARRGYGELHQGLFAAAIDVAMRRDDARGALALAEQARARALLDLMRASPQDPGATPADVPAMQALARRLGSTLVVYWVGTSDAFAWVVSDRGVTAHRLPVGARQLQKLVQAAAGHGNVPATINAALLGGPDLHAWRALHRALIEPLAADLPTATGSRLTLVPHGPLLHLPFAGLLDARGRYLIERHVLHYAPSVAVLAAATDRPPAGADGPVVVVGDPAPLPRLPGVTLPPRLPYARQEARQVARRFPGRARLVVGAEATERALRAQAGAAAWVHVATHARVSEEVTAPSYLLLARGSGGDADDGRLTADEVRALSLTGATVVLSACRTALGRVTGEGALGFTRSFLAAGARAIVATTWEMPDDAGLRVMDAFYVAQAAGASVPEAMRTAQLRQLRALRAGTLTRKVGNQVVRLPAIPLLWAGYVAVGVP